MDKTQNDKQEMPSGVTCTVNLGLMLIPGYKMTLFCIGKLRVCHEIPLWNYKIKENLPGNSLYHKTKDHLSSKQSPITGKF